MSIAIRRMNENDCERMSNAFTAMGWNCPVAKFASFLERYERNEIVPLIAEVNSEFAGYLKVVWQPDYPFFRENGIPEIQDLNVVNIFRRQGVASSLMDEAEKTISKRSATIGIGVGLHPGYNAAQRMYVLRGYVPDGKGVVWHNEYIKEGQELKADDELILHFTKAIGAEKGNGKKVSTAFLIHGFVGSGKTTFSKKLEKDISAIRLNHDEWMIQLYGAAPPKEHFDEYYRNVHEIIWELGLRLMKKGQSVIFDNGFWTRASRDEARNRILQAGHDFKLFALRCKDQEMKERVLKRTDRMPDGAFWINESAIEEFRRRFEPLESDEEHEEIQTD
jgi:predicted kinase/ribosomal protein S18 acetylase RimI-like enzyme